MRPIKEDRRLEPKKEPELNSVPPLVLVRYAVRVYKELDSLIIPDKGILA